MMIEEALAKFLVQLEADGRSQHTRKQYERHVRLVARWARDVGNSREVSEITHEDIALFLSAPVVRTRPDGGLKKATSVNALRTSLKCFLSYLHRAGYISQDPGRLIRRAICSSAPPSTLSEADQNRLMDTLATAQGPEAKRDHALFRLMLATGIRLGSAVALDVEDVDFERGELWLKSTKGDRPDLIFLGRDIREHLRGFLAGGSKGPLFTGRNGNRLSHRHVQRRFSQWLEKSGIARSATVHSLRGTFASELYRRTREVLLVKEALRHRSISSTLAYIVPNEDRLRQVLQV